MTEKRDPGKQCVDYQSGYRESEFCGKCGTPLKGGDTKCPGCHLWLLVHDDTIIKDKKLAAELRKKHRE